MKENHTPAETQPIHTQVERREKGLVEALIRNEYYLNSATGQVTLIVKRALCNPNLPDNEKLDQEVSKKTLTPTEIPEYVREIVKALMDGEKSAS
jgi:hypothetical protein